MSTALSRLDRPPPAWRKYWTMLSSGVQGALTYRAAATVWMIVDFAPAPLMVMLSVMSRSPVAAAFSPRPAIASG